MKPFSTVSIFLVPLQLVAIHKATQLLREAPSAMVLFLGDISGHFSTAGVRDRKGPVASAPCELAWDQGAVVYPVRRSALEKVHGVFEAQIRGQIHEGMHVIGVDVVDSHVDSLLRGVLGQEGRHLDRRGAGEQGPALQRSPDQMHPDAEKRMAAGWRPAAIRAKPLPSPMARSGVNPIPTEPG